MSNELKSNKKTDAINGSFTLSENDDRGMIGSFNVGLSKNKNIFNIFNKFFGFLIVFITFLAILLGVYGFEYQKGMIDATGLENINANYEIKEIYHFSFIGLNRSFLKLVESDFFPDGIDFAFCIFVFLLSGFFFVVGSLFCKEKCEFY